MPVKRRRLMAKRGDKNSDDADTVVSGSGQDTIRLILQCIERHMSDAGLEQRIASEVNMDRDGLSLLIEQTFGQTLEAYILQERMRAAQRMLLESSASIAAIARAVGYPSTSAFTSIFRKQLRMAPTTFRKTAPLEKLTSSAGGMLRWG